MSTLIKHRKRGRKSKIPVPADLDFTGKSAVMIVDKKPTRTKKSAKKDCKKMLPVTGNLENSIDILENLSKELIHVGDCNKNDIHNKELDNVNEKESTAVSFSRLPRGRKRRTVPRVLDFTGHSPVMVMEPLNKLRMASESLDYKEEQLFAILDRSVDIVDKLAHELVFEHECKAIHKQKLAQMTTEELKDYAKFIANKINLSQPNIRNS